MVQQPVALMADAEANDVSKLNCQPGNYQCGRICISNGRRCWQDIPANEVETFEQFTQLAKRLNKELLGSPRRANQGRLTKDFFAKAQAQGGPEAQLAYLGRHIQYWAEARGMTNISAEGGAKLDQLGQRIRKATHPVPSLNEPGQLGYSPEATQELRTKAEQLEEGALDLLDTIVPSLEAEGLEAGGLTEGVVLPEQGEGVSYKAYKVRLSHIATQIGEAKMSELLKHSNGLVLDVLWRAHEDSETAKEGNKELFELTMKLVQDESITPRERERQYRIAANRLKTRQALNAKRMGQALINALPDGTMLTNSPIGGAEGTRAKLYERQGFGKTTRGMQMAIKLNGRLWPIQADEHP